MISVHKRLEFWAGLKPNELAFVDGKKEITFAELHIHTLQVATILNELGIRRGDLVCTMLPAYLDWPIVLALQILGATSFAKPTTANFDSYAEPRWLIASKEHSQFSTQNTIVLNEKVAEKVNDAKLFVPEVEPHNFTQPIRLSSTSGTTGESKYLRYSAAEMHPRLVTPSGVNFLGNGKFLNLMLFGAAQSYNWAHRSLLEGKTFFMSASTNESNFEYLQKYGIETVYGSPQQISALLETADKFSHSLDEKYNLVIGGSAPSGKLLSKIREKHKCAIYNSHGSAETGFISMCDLTVENSPGLIIHPNSVVQILDENDVEFGFDRVGYIRYKIPHASNSYLNNPEETKKSFKDGYFYSGDMGYKTKDGRLHITGRSNEVINFGGVKINPEQVDGLVLAETGVQDAASFALDDESGIPKLAVALVVDHEFDETAFLSSLKAKFTRAVIAEIFKVNSIPRNPNGKILRRELSKKFSSK